MNKKRAYMGDIRKKLRDIDWLHRIHLAFYGWKEFLFVNGLEILKTRWNYHCRLKEVRAKFGKEKIRIVFMMVNPAKWKVQSLYDALARSEKFDPVVALTIMDQETNLSEEKKIALLGSNREYLEKLGCKCIDAYLPNRGCIPLSELKPDIVWFTQPWYIDKCQSPEVVSKYALSCYTPYFVQNYGGLSMDCLLPFHRFLWRHFTLNDAWADEFMLNQGCRRAGCTVGCGHPMLDVFLSKESLPVCREYVIYAPHFSIGIAECFSTFGENGEKMLELAKQHPELKWVFKPHPNLRGYLHNVPGWSREKVDWYYNEWERIGTVCYDGSYIELFNKSCVMITDCASFLVEYACTKQPIIRLISSDAKVEPHPISVKLFKSYYEARNWEEFCKWFDIVVLQRKDPNRSERLNIISEMKLLGVNAAENTINYLEKELSNGDN